MVDVNKPKSSGVVLTPKLIAAANKHFGKEVFDPKHDVGKILVDADEKVNKHYTRLDTYNDGVVGIRYDGKLNNYEKTIDVNMGEVKTIYFRKCPQAYRFAQCGKSFKPKDLKPLKISLFIVGVFGIEAIPQAGLDALKDPKQIHGAVALFKEAMKPDVKDDVWPELPNGWQDPKGLIDPE